MLTFTDNIYYNHIFHNNENKQILIKHFNLVILHCIDRFAIPENIQITLNESIELCQEYIIISPQNRLRNMISNFDILMKFFNTELKSVQKMIKNYTQDDDMETLTLDEKLLSSIVKRYNETYSKLLEIRLIF